MVAARAAAEGDYDAAIPAQAEAAAMAGRLFGPDSMQRNTAILNLGSLHFRAEQFSEAFDAYREGLERLYTDGAAADRLGQALQNAFRAGLEAQRFAEAGRLMVLLASRSGAMPAAITLNGMASLALLRANQPRDAVAAFSNALTVFGGMGAREAVRWAEPVAEMAGMFAGRLEDPEATLLAGALRSLDVRAEAAGWRQALSERQDWIKLLTDLDARSTGRQSS
jgi:tetratricopeptide (TPR) repeat protein